jgi:hypothetical protein
MLYWLIANVALWVLFAWAYRYANRGGAPDDFASGIVALFVGCAAALSTLAYLVGVFWLHRFV